MLKYIDPEKVYISLLSGYNTYFETDDYTEILTGERAMVIQHIRTKELYYAVSSSAPANLLNDEWFINKWKKLIELPCNSNFVWPVDFISKDISLSQGFLVYEFYPKYKYDSIASLSKTKDFLGIENSQIKTIVLDMLRAFENLENKNYLYFGIDDDKLFINMEKTSILIPINEEIGIDRDNEILFTENDFFSEVVDPYSYAIRKKNERGNNIYIYDSVSENYGLVSILFRLLIGLYPYEGPMLDEYEYNLSSSENKDWIFKYLQNPVFIFDKDDKSNSIKMFNKNKVHRERWGQLTEKLREMFITSLSHDNVMRKTRVLYSPKQWRLAVEEAFNNIS